MPKKNQERERERTKTNNKKRKEERFCICCSQAQIGRAPTVNIVINIVKNVDVLAKLGMICD